MAFTGPIEDRLFIRELYGTYADAAFRQDVEAYLSCWCEDGTRLSQQGDNHGKPELRTAWQQIWTMIERMAFFSEVGAIEVDGDRATGRCWCREIIDLKGGAIWKVVGLYEDELRREAGQWRFRQRKYTLFLNERRD